MSDTKEIIIRELQDLSFAIARAGVMGFGNQVAEIADRLARIIDQPARPTVDEIMDKVDSLDTVSILFGRAEVGSSDEARLQDYGARLTAELRQLIEQALQPVAVSDAVDAKRWRFIMDHDESEEEENEIVSIKEMWLAISVSGRSKPTRKEYEAAIDAAIALAEQVT